MRPADGRARAGYALLFAVAALTFGAGLARAGLWQPAELRAVGAAQGLADVAPEPPDAREVALVRAGIRVFGASDLGARAPGALFALAAALTLAAAVGHVTGDPRAGVLTGVAYATMPLVFLNARHAGAGAAAQSAATLVFAATLCGLWARGPRRWLAPAAAVGLALAGGCTPVDAAPALLGAGAAVALRWSREPRGVRLGGATLAAVGAGLAVATLRGIAARGADAPATFEAVLEQLGHATFPWTGLVALGTVRLLAPPPGVTRRESGARLAAWVALVAAYGLQCATATATTAAPFVAAAPLAMAAALVLRDAEREARPWRLVAGCTLVDLVVVARDLLQFPRATYAALGLAGGGPAWPAALSESLGAWSTRVGSHAMSSCAHGDAPAAVYVALAAGVFALLALPALFLGGGRVARIAWSRPWTRLGAIERAARIRRAAVMSRLRLGLLGVAGAVTAGCGALACRHSLPTPLRVGLFALALAPLGLTLAVYAVLALWNLTARVSQRLTLVPLAAVVAALVFTQGLDVALGRHLSPRDAWAALRAARRNGEPVARYGEIDAAAARWYAGVAPTALDSEHAAVAWLRDTASPRYLVVATPRLATLNRAYRAALPAGARRNVPVLDPGNAMLLVAATDGRARNPLDDVVATATDAPWLAAPSASPPARFDDAIELAGYAVAPGPRVALGSAIELTYVFRVLRAVAADYEIFVHVDGPCPRTNGDHAPAGGRYPTSLWLPGDAVRDTQQLRIPAYCRPGVYSVYMGFFRGGARMAVRNGRSDGDNRVLVTTLEAR